VAVFGMTPFGWRFMGALIGALMLGVLNNGLNMMGVSPYVQNIIKGLIILFAIYISRERRRRR
jgi:ribose transport system permease protein